jgi:pimeloyl-ACP methyl ester carboxylesterase
LAVIAPNREAKLLEITGRYDRVIIGGHSLGGAMAARFALKNPEKVNGLILMGAFSAKSDDLSVLDIPTLSLAAEHDGLATLDEIKASLVRLPKDTTLEIIQGAVHSFFGRYGPQRGDGIPSVSRSQAEAEIVKVLKAFIDRP